MNPIYLLKVMGEMGARYKESQIGDIINYTTQMIDNGRVFVISDEHGPLAVLFISVTDNPDIFLKKGQFEFKTHNPEGKLFYIEKLISKGWNRKLRNQLESEILNRYPQATHSVWHRYGRYGDRKVTTTLKRRLQNV